MRSSSWEKNLKNWENTGLFWIGKQPVFGFKIGKIKSLSTEGLFIGIQCLLLFNVGVLSKAYRVTTQTRFFSLDVP